MRLHRHPFLFFAALFLVAPPLAKAQGQGIPRTARRLGAAVPNAPRLMVAIPFSAQGRDSAPAVEIGDGLRKRMGKVVGSDLYVIPDTIMNNALVQFGYARNAILSPTLQLTLAKNIQARYLVGATLNRLQDGRYSVSARFAGVNDDAGVVHVVQQEAGEKLDKFGERVADAFGPAVKAMDDAKACVDQAKAKPDKAVEAAQKALKTVPNHGLAALCIAQVRQAQGAPRAEIIQSLELASKGDALSLPIWTQLAEQHQAGADTAKVLDAFSEMLRVAPTNQKMREQIFQYMLRAGKPERAVRVADEGLAVDPYNWDLYDLKSNAFLFLGNFKGAIDALEQAFEGDSTLADTLFYKKINIAAAQQPDTARLLKWSKKAVAKYPGNAEFLGYLNQAWVLNGQLDSSLAVSRQLMEVDPTNVAPALAAVQGLATAKRIAEAKPFVEFVSQKGDAQQKEQLGGILVNAAAPLVQNDPKDFKGAAEITRECLTVAQAGTRISNLCSFILGFSAFQLAAAMDSETEKQKSCDLARQENDLVLEAEKNLAIGKAANEAGVKQLEPYVAQFKTRTASMVKAYCK